jgi:hypothetical protein
MAMCNASLIADKLKTKETNDPYRDKITFIAIYIGNDETQEEAIWLRDYFVSQTDAGDPLFAMVSEYDEVKEALLYLFEKLDFIQNR